MKPIPLARCVLTCLVVMTLSSHAWSQEMKRIELPKPNMKGSISVEEAMQKRRSVRSYAAKPVSREIVSQLLWACQGISDTVSGHRVAPSAGALYPLEVYLASSEGVFRYIPQGHLLERVSDKDIRQELSGASYGQPYVAEAAIDIIVTAVYERVTSKYGERGIRYTDMEAGHAAQNVFLQAVALGLDSVAVGAFSDSSVSKILQLPSGTKPLYILPVGYRK